MALPFPPIAGLFLQLMDCYANSTIPKHCHLLAIAIATALRSNVAIEHLPLTRLAYFVATISTLNDSELGLDLMVLSTLVSFMAIALPLVSPRRSCVRLLRSS